MKTQYIIIGLIATLVCVYTLGFMGLGYYYNWTYAHDHGFLNWLLLGGFVPTAKALVWPYFAFVQGDVPWRSRNRASIPTWSDEEKQNAMHFHLSTDAADAAVKLSNLGPAYSVISQSELAETNRLMKIALQEAKVVRNEVLDKAFPGLSRLFREKYQRSLELKIRTFEDKYNIAGEFESGRLYNEWIDWINEHGSEIRFPK